MLSSNTSVNSCSKTKLTFSLISLLLVLSARQTKVEIVNPVPKTTFVYDQKKEEFEKSETQFERIDFRDGEWFFVKGLNLLEFHPRVPGFLDFSSGNRSFYKALYLDNFKRVLVFPQKGVDSNRTPYVDQTQVFNDDYEAVKIYPQKERTLRACFSDDDVFEMIFPANKRAGLVRDWNRLPFMDPQISGKGTFNSFNNYWGTFLHFNYKCKIGLLSKQSDSTEQNARVTTKSYIMLNMIRRVFSLIFSDDKELGQYPYLDNKQALEAEQINNLAKKIQVHLEKNEKTKEKYLELEQKLFDSLYAVSEDYVSFYLLNKIPQYLQFVFDNTSAHLTLKSWYETWKKHRLNFPRRDWQMPWDSNVLKEINYEIKLIKSQSVQDVIDRLNQINGTRARVEGEFQNLIKELMEFLLNSLSETIDEQDREDINGYFESEFKKYQKTYTDINQNFAKIQKQVSQKLTQLTPKKIYDNFLEFEGINIAMYWSEERLFNDYLKKWPMWGKMEMKMYGKEEYNLFPWFRSLLVLVGVLPYDRHKEPWLFENTGIEIFKINNRRVMI